MATGKNEFEVVRRSTIDAPPQAVYDLIVDFHHWRRWSPWEDVDPAMQRTYSGADAGVGAVYEWSGDRKAGQGRMEIVEVSAPSLVVVALQFIKPFKASNTTTFELVAADGGTVATWRMVGPRTLVTRIMGVFKSMDAMIGPDFEKGLGRLRRAAMPAAD